MDGSSFDHLSRRLAGLGSRRLALKTIAAALVASVTGERTAHAQSCTAIYRPCQSDGQCCTGAVCQSGICQPGCRIDGVFRSASTPQPGTTCARCDPSRSTTTWSSVNEGMACWSGAANLCGGPSTCQNGSCTGTSSITCQPLTACHIAGACNPGTGLCTHPPAPAGIPCGGAETCLGGLHTPGMTCDGNGFCTAGSTRPCAPYACGTSACLTSCSSNTQCAPGAVCVDTRCVVPAGNGAPCADGRFCQSGFCRDSVCCNEACESACSTCATGACRPKNCSDNLACTADSCDPTTGNCVHTRSPATCLIAGACYANGAQNPADRCQVCDPAVNSWVAVVCDDGLPCTTDACDPATGDCTYTLNPEFCALGGACYEHGAPNPANRCQLCDAATNSWVAKVCDDHHACTADTCDSATGDCVFTLNPGFCLLGDACYAGGAPNPANQCQLCDPATNSWVAKVCDDDLPCTADSCDPSTGDCVHTRHSDACLIQGVCYAEDAPNPADPCQLCDPVANAWVAKVCNDGLDCTADSCDPDSGSCVHTRNSDSCLIDGVCYAGGAPDPADRCQLCNPGANGWVAKICNDGLDCTLNLCLPETGACLHPVQPGFCTFENACYTIDFPHPENACQLCSPGGVWLDKPCLDDLSCTTDGCDPITGACVHTRNPDSCLIDGVCYAEGAPNPTNPCQLCDPDINAWIAKVCDDGNPCSLSYCNTGTGQCVHEPVTGLCRYGDTCYPGGAPHPENPCRICSGLDSWFDKFCFDGLSCTTDSCNPATGECVFTPNPGFCALGGVCYADGAPNPANACQRCDATTNSWGDQICTGGTCVDGTCVCPPFTTLSGDACVHPCTLPHDCLACSATQAGSVHCLTQSTWSCFPPCSSTAECPVEETCLSVYPPDCAHGEPVCVGSY